MEICSNIYWQFARRREVVCGGERIFSGSAPLGLIPIPAVFRWALYQSDRESDVQIWRMEVHSTRKRFIWCSPCKSLGHCSLLETKSLSWLSAPAPPTDHHLVIKMGHHTPGQEEHQDIQIYSISCRSQETILRVWWTLIMLFGWHLSCELLQTCPL